MTYFSIALTERFSSAPMDLLGKSVGQLFQDIDRQHRKIVEGPRVTRPQAEASAELRWAGRGARYAGHSGGRGPTNGTCKDFAAFFFTASRGRSTFSSNADKL